MTFPEGSIRRRRHGSSRGSAANTRERDNPSAWEDCGPFTTEDWPYVFGDKPPVNTQNKGAGIDISPAVRDYLGITGGTAIVHWRFVEFYRIPRGPWSKYGDNNPFVNAGLGAGKKSLQSREDRLRQQQEAIQRELLKDPAKLRRELQG